MRYIFIGLLFFSCQASKPHSNLDVKQKSDPEIEVQKWIESCEVKLSAEMSSEDIILTANRMRLLCSYKEEQVLAIAEKVFR